MMTLKQVSELTGVNIMTLQYYDKIGLIRSQERTDTGERLYDKDALLRLQEILLFRELEMPLKDIIAILNDASRDKQKALQRHAEFLELKKQHIEGLLSLIHNIMGDEGSRLDFSIFNTKKMDECKKQIMEQL